MIRNTMSKTEKAYWDAVKQFNQTEKAMFENDCKATQHAAEIAGKRLTQARIIWQRELACK